MNRFGRRNYPSKGQLRAGKALLAAAFRHMRAHGLLARQNFMCCRGCAENALWNDIDANPGKYKGAVYYHHQDNDDLREKGEFYLGFGAADTDDNPTTVEVGEIVKKALEKFSLIVEWDGTARKRILVKFPFEQLIAVGAA